MNPVFDVIIIGGGLAGLTAAIHLSRAGRSVVLFEKNPYPKHKVCGEYVSNEVLPYLEFLCIDISTLKPANITKTILSTASGKTVSGALPIGGFGVSRHAFDHHLYLKACAEGCKVIHESVTDVAFAADVFTINTTGNRTWQSTFVLGAYGKRANLDQQLERQFVATKSPWLAVKAHFSGVFPNDLVGLHNFKGGYCGVSKVENDIINICWLADYESFKKYKDIAEYQQEVLCRNPRLAEIFSVCEPIFEKPVTISQVSFASKPAVENHILMIGDTAGLIHPLCGNGIAIAIHSAKLASELLLDYFAGKTNRQHLERQYEAEWKRHFGRRMAIGKWLGSILENENASDVLMKTLAWFPALLPRIIRMTHGKPIAI